MNLNNHLRNLIIITRFFNARRDLLSGLPWIFVRVRIFLPIMIRAMIVLILRTNLLKFLSGFFSDQIYNFMEIIVRDKIILNA